MNASAFPLRVMLRMIYLAPLDSTSSKKTSPPASARHDVVGVTFKSPLADDAPPSAGPRTRGRIRSRLGIDADKLLLKVNGLRI